MGSRTPRTSPAAEAQARITQQLFTQTDPLRRDLIGRSTDFLQGDLDVTGTPQYAALRDIAGTQFDRARERIIANTPEGGALTARLADLDTSLASQLAQGGGVIADTELERAMRLATGTTGASLGGLGQAGATQAALAQARGVESAGAAQGLGTLVGTGVGFALGGPAGGAAGGAAGGKGASK